MENKNLDFDGSRNRIRRSWLPRILLVYCCLRSLILFLLRKSPDMIKNLFSGLNLPLSESFPRRNSHKDISLHLNGGLSSVSLDNVHGTHGDLNNNNNGAGSYGKLPLTARRSRKQGHYVHRLNGWVNSERRKARDDSSLFSKRMEEGDVM